MEELVALGAGMPAAVLAKRASDAVGGLLRPWQMRRNAKAEADVSLIRAQTEIDVQSLHERARYRANIEEMTRQRNMELILDKSVPHLDQDNASPHEMEQDWIINFFEKARLISDEEMQDLWARILAGEANHPGSFSRKTVNIMEDLGKGEAELFASVCRYVWVINSMKIPVIDSSDINTNPIYHNQGIDFLTIKHLEDIGILRYNGVAGFIIQPSSRTIRADYFGKVVEIDLKEQKNMDVNNALFTVAGRELYEIVRSTLRPIDGFFDFVYDKWAEKSLVPPRNIPQGS